MKRIRVMRSMGAAVLCLVMTAAFSWGAAAGQNTGPSSTVFLPVIFGRQAAATQPVEILANTTYFMDSTGYLHIAGEVANHTANHLRFIEIGASFYDSADRWVGSDNTATSLYSLPAYDRTCFEMITDPPAGSISFRFDAPTFSTDGYPLPKLTVIHDHGIYDNGWYDVTGQVRNDSGRTVKFVSPVGTLYNAAGKVIGCDYIYVNSFNLAANQTSDFDLAFVRRDYSDAATYRLQVDGELQ